MDLTNIVAQTKVALTTKKASFEGVFIQKDNNVVVLKLDSGYNIGIDEQEITDIQILEKPEQNALQQKSNPSIEQPSDLARVKILHTGGTIASRVDYKTGAVIADFSPEALIAMFPELAEIAKIESDFLGNMWSDDFRFADFNKIAQAVLQGAKKGITKFIVTSGTDFLHYLSAALSFILKDVPVSVLVVGAQRSSDRGSSDAGMNLVCATTFLAETSFKGVAVCMHTSSSDTICSILPGTQVRKMHSTRRDAFKAINAPIIADIDYTSRAINIYPNDMSELQTDDVLPETLPLLKEDLKIGLLYSHPNMFAEEFKAYEHFDGLVLAGSGLGHFPISQPNTTSQEHGRIKNALQELAQQLPVVMSVQTIYGRVHMNVYAPGRELQDMGVIGHGSAMTPETSYIKLAWLLSNYPDDITTLFMQDIVGELPVMTFVEGE